MCGRWQIRQFLKKPPYFRRLHVPDLSAKDIGMDDIFTQCREGNSVAVRLWLDNTENDLNLGWADIIFKHFTLGSFSPAVWWVKWFSAWCIQNTPWHFRGAQIVSILCFFCSSTCCWWASPSFGNSSLFFFSLPPILFLNFFPLWCHAPKLCYKKQRVFGEVWLKWLIWRILPYYSLYSRQKNTGWILDFKTADFCDCHTNESAFNMNIQSFIPLIGQNNQNVHDCSVVIQYQIIHKHNIKCGVQPGRMWGPVNILKNCW